MKHITAFLSVSALLLCICGCQTKTGEQKAESPTVTVAPKESQEWIDVADKEKGKTEFVLNQGVKLENLQKQGEDAEFYCNLTENITGGGKEPVLVCPDPVYNITYFVNYGRDYLIYAVRGDKSELVVEIPARDLFCKDGELYFLVEDYGKFALSGVKDGDIVKYNPADGSLEPVLSANADAMIVYPDAIHYSVGKSLPSGAKLYETKVYSFEKKADEPVSGMCQERFRDYQIVLETVKYEGEVPKGMEADAPYMTSVVKTKLLHITDGTEQDLPGYEMLPQKGRLNNYHLIQEQIYYFDETSGKTPFLYCYSPVTGERNCVIDKELPEDTGSLPFFLYDDFVILNTYLYYSFSENEVFAFHCIQNGEVLKELTLSAFFTDGKELYCIYDDVLFRMVKTQFMGEDSRITKQIAGGPMHEYFYGDISMELENPVLEKGGQK